mgnify:CR=1 FL=1
MWRVISTDAYSTLWAIDSDADIQTPPGNARQGDMAMLCESADGSGLGRPFYMLNSEGIWVK